MEEYTFALRFLQSLYGCSQTLCSVHFNKFSCPDMKGSGCKKNEKLRSILQEICLSRFDEKIQDTALLAVGLTYQLLYFFQLPPNVIDVP